MKKAILILCVVLVALGATWFFLSDYLLSKLDGMGTSYVPQLDMLGFASVEMGVGFEYSPNYEPKLTTEGNAERAWQTVVLMPKGYVPPQGGEGPPVITVQAIPNPEDIGLETWIKGDARSNWKLAEEGALSSALLGGEPAFRYRHSGLYESAVAAVAHGGKIYLFSVGWLTPEDEQVAEFERLLSSVEFL